MTGRRAQGVRQRMWGWASMSSKGPEVDCCADVEGGYVALRLLCYPEALPVLRV